MTTGARTKLIFRAVWAGLGLCLLAGCAAPASQNRKVYDRYAALVAERNRTPEVPASASAPAPAPRPAMQPAAGAGTPSQAPAKPAPVQVLVPKPTEKTEAPSTPAASTPVSPAPAAPPQAQPASKPAAPPYVSSPTDDGVAYQLKVGDVVQVFLRGIPSGEAIEDVIDEDGMISLPLINEIRAAGMTASELERNIRQTYLDQDIYRNITVNVVVPTRYYFIQGEIRGPGKFQLVTATRVSQAIAAAGGYTEYASGQVLIKRSGKIIKTIRNSRRLERTPEDDILLEPDDIIEVRRSLW